MGPCLTWAETPKATNMRLVDEWPSCGPSFVQEETLWCPRPRSSNSYAFTPQLTAQGIRSPVYQHNPRPTVLRGTLVWYDIDVQSRASGEFEPLVRCVLRRVHNILYIGQNLVWIGTPAINTCCSEKIGEPIEPLADSATETALSPHQICSGRKGAESTRVKNSTCY